MRQVERGALGLDDPVARYIPAWRDEGAVVVTIRDLLAHCSGLPAHVPFFREHTGRTAFEDAIVQTPRAYEPRTTSVYSDLGFMLLGFILESHRAARDAVRHDAPADGGHSGSAVPSPGDLETEDGAHAHDPWRGRLLVGEVDDDNAWALGGAAGHAGLFGAVGVGRRVRAPLLQVLEGRTGRIHAGDRGDVRRASQPRFPDSSRALGWDTMLPTSSCGTRMSPRAFGHIGFTGTSLWIDPERSVYVGAADEPRASDAGQQRDHSRQASVARRGDRAICRAQASACAS